MSERKKVELQWWSQTITQRILRISKKEEIGEVSFQFCVKVVLILESLRGGVCYDGLWVQDFSQEIIMILIQCVVVDYVLCGHK